MRFRKLRIAWSVAWGVAAVLLILSWRYSRGTWQLTQSLQGVSSLLLLGAIVWLPVRFGLRDLLIATTLVAVVLGLIVWLR